MIGSIDSRPRESCGESQDMNEPDTDALAMNNNGALPLHLLLHQ